MKFPISLEHTLCNTPRTLLRAALRPPMHARGSKPGARFLKPECALLTIVVAWLSCGCVVGPAALRASRVRYNDVIQKTTDEQLLLNLVRLQYRQAPSFLEVGSVSAQFTFGQSADIIGTINEGPNPVNPDRLGLQAGVDYTERPTVTFTPLQGKEFVHALLSPLQPEVIVLLSQSGWSIDRVLRLTVQGMNGVDNASSASGPTPDRVPRFRRFARLSRLFRLLQKEGLLELGYESREISLSDELPVDRASLADVLRAAREGYRLRAVPSGTRLQLTTSAKTLVWRIPAEAGDRPEVREIVALLGLAQGLSSYEIRMGTGATGANVEPGQRAEIHLVMRSLMGTLFYLSQGVEVPVPHRKKGLVTSTVDGQGRPFDWSDVTGDLLRAHVQFIRPAGAAIAVRHRGYWFYIDDADLSSKSTFALLGQLFALQAGGVESVAPVLTLPVGG